MIFFIIGTIILLFGSVIIWRYFLYLFKKTEIIASPKQQLSRLETCDRCEMLSISMTVARRCSECGCFIDVKARLQNQNCPLGKWSKIAN